MKRMTKERENIRKILLVPDVPGWAFDHHARDMMAMPSNRVQLDIKYQHEVQKEDANQYEFIYPMAVIMAHSLYQKGIPLNKLVAGISSERQFRFFQNQNQQLSKKFLQFFKGLRAVNTASDEFVERFSRYRPVHKTRVGVDIHQFKPLKQRKENPVFTVGWVGSSKDNELKGYHIVEKALLGLPVKLDIRTKTEHFVSRDEMITYYQGLDCFLCASRSEHIPLPVFEAAACGVPIISTKVGIVPELIKSYQNGMIVDRTPAAFRKAIQYIMRHQSVKEKMAIEIRKTIVKNWA
ncbi:glycosyltransferase family 4 protein [Fervidibacillus halotolerans]|uniref:Glycosyltransferase family 4 protein n=1 Tax=Fervidibacillus halotolerans TaxID=2980027 RepID=A0A9E8M2E6_9BACI|nr:glycosyltransferase family 4 protein [Fervidibacillus halotolerans]WAA13134.1 glycosyltransferase family 4 protein [Fervidibacillus halotolerans]